VRAPAAGADDPYQGRGPGSRQHQHRVHPDGTGALKKRSAVHWQVPGRVERQASNGCRGCPNSCSLRALLRQRSRCPERAAAPEAAGPAIEPPGTGHEARQLAVDLGFTPLAPPKSSRTAPREYDRETYRRPGGFSGSSRASTGSTSCSPDSSSLRFLSMRRVVLTRPSHFHQLCIEFS